MAYIELTAEEAIRTGCRGCGRVVVVDQPSAPRGVTEHERIARQLVGTSAHPAVLALIDGGMFAAAIAEHANLTRPVAAARRRAS